MNSTNASDASILDEKSTELKEIGAPVAKRKLESSEDSTTPSKKIRLECYESDNGKSELEDIDYYFENGLRKVYPYYYTFSTFCKGRWVGQKIYDVFAREFRAYDKDHYKEQITLGLLKVNNKITIVDHVLKNNDRITHQVHRHEIAVLGAPIKIIHSDNDLLVIDKPPSVPVHPCGRYRRNTILSILAKEHNMKGLHTIHRLDRLTSGILIFTKTLLKSQEIDELIRSHQIQKEYLCRVEGLFPDETVTCCEPIETISKIGVCIVSSSGRECKTEFKKLSYNGMSSLILCKPFTGRMHQIRVHLQYLGYPIINDPLYNHDEAFGPKKGKGGDMGKSKEQLIIDLMEIHRLDKWLQEENNVCGVKSQAGLKADGNIEDQRRAKADGDIKDQTRTKADGDIQDQTRTTADGDIQDQTRTTADGDIQDQTRTTADGDIKDQTRTTADSDIKGHTRTRTDGDMEDQTRPKTDGDIKDQKRTKTNGTTEDQARPKAGDDNEDQIRMVVDDDTKDQVRMKANEILKKILSYNMSMQEYQKLAERYVKRMEKIVTDKGCSFCQTKYKDPEPKDLILFLHAFKYKSDTWEFQTDLPIWAQDDWQEM